MKVEKNQHYISQHSISRIRTQRKMETYSDDGKFAKKLNEYVGHKLKYFDSLTGRDEFGVLRGTQFDLKSHSLVALFEVRTIFVRIQLCFSIHRKFTHLWF